MYIYTYICIYTHVYIYISVISIILISRVLYFKMERHHKKISIEKSVIKLSFATSLRASETSLSWLFYIKSPRRRPTEKIRRFFIIIIIIISFFSLSFFFFSFLFFSLFFFPFSSYTQSSTSFTTYVCMYKYKYNII